MSFSPAVSRAAVVRIRRTIRSWRLHRRSDLTFPESSPTSISAWSGGSPITGGSTNLPSMWRWAGSTPSMRWARRKYKSLKHSQKRAWAFLMDMANRVPGMFAHWRFGVLPN